MTQLPTQLAGQALYKTSRYREFVRAAYVRLIRPFVTTQIHRQRIKLLWDVWGYLPLLTNTRLKLSERLTLLGRFLRVDWSVPHGHKPLEISAVVGAVTSRPARPGEVLVEAGCWQGGSSAKFSVLAKMFGYKLRVYDSFQGVHRLTVAEKFKSHDFSGEYASPESVLRKHLDLYGEPDAVDIHPGWFHDTIATDPVPVPVRAAYIDCDLARGTREVLVGVLPALAEDGWILTQDYHIPQIRALLNDHEMWESWGVPAPRFRHVGGDLALAQMQSS